MRILHIDTGREMRGGQWQVLRLMEGLRAAGVESCLAARAEAPLYAQAGERGFSVERLSVSSVLVGQAVSPAKAIDLIHAHDARSHAMAAALGRTKLVVSRRVAFPIRTGPLSRWKYQRADHYIAVSQFVRTSLTDRGIPADKISVVYDGVPLMPTAEGGTRVLAPPPSRDKPAEWYEKIGVEISFANNLEADLKTAAIFVYLSMSEGLGSGVLLAMAAGVPVIASRTGGIPEIVRHEENGLLVDGRAEAVAAAVKRLRDDPAFARKLAEEGRRTVTQKFSIAAMVRDTLAVYRRILAC